MKIIHVNCGLGIEHESDIHSNERYLSGCGNKARQKFQSCTGFEPITIDIRYFSSVEAVWAACEPRNEIWA